MHAQTTNLEKHTTKNPIGRLFLNRFLKTLVKEVKMCHPVTILDVGCGEGFVLHELRKQNIGKKLEGVDAMPEAIEIGKKLHPHLKLKVGDIYKLPYKDNSFDAVLCCEVLEHLEHPEKALKELKRVSKKHVILSVPNEPHFTIQRVLRGKNIREWGAHPEHINHWSSKQFRTLVEKHLRIFDLKKPLPWTMIVGVK
jgi:ubiquinone/menaquinone biosynthesis C-methylase UbiE